MAIKLSWTEKTIVLCLTFPLLPVFESESRNEAGEYIDPSQPIPRGSYAYSIDAIPHVRGPFNGMHCTTVLAGTVDQEAIRVRSTHSITWIIQWRQYSVHWLMTQLMRVQPASHVWSLCQALIAHVSRNLCGSEIPKSPISGNHVHVPCLPPLVHAGWSVACRRFAITNHSPRRTQFEVTTS